jgi:S1-C subfamily serine protease
MKIRRFVLVCAFLSGFALYLAASATTFAQPGVDRWNDPQQLGSVDQYTHDGWDFEDAEFQASAIGISVRNMLGALASGQPVSGVGVLTVASGSPADAAGVHGARAALRATLVGAFFAGAMMFPPAMFGAVLVEQSGLGQPRDLVIAVDGMRTHNVIEFENAIGRATVGQLVYLTVLRGGVREQLRMRVRD